MKYSTAWRCAHREQWTTRVHTHAGERAAARTRTNTTMMIFILQFFHHIVVLTRLACACAPSNTRYRVGILTGVRTDFLNLLAEAFKASVLSTSRSIFSPRSSTFSAWCKTVKGRPHASPHGTTYQCFAP